MVIALEMSLGAIVAGPFKIAERDLTAMIQKVMDAEGKASRSAKAASTPLSPRESPLYEVVRAHPLQSRERSLSSGQSELVAGSRRGESRRLWPAGIHDVV